jgi:D-arabinose 1-dehydrogenase-like Zn-dependent alcohol dehydrogenase
MGTRDELERLIRFCLERDIRPTIHSTMPLSDARAGFEAIHGGDVVGKIVFTT